jgi:hypothetical protein
MSSAVRNALTNIRSSSRSSSRSTQQMLRQQMEQKTQLLKDLRQLEHRVLQELYDLETQRTQPKLPTADKYCKEKGYKKQQNISNSPIPPYKGVGLENVEQFCKRHRFITSKPSTTKVSPSRPRVLQTRLVSNRRRLVSPQ